MTPDTVLVRANDILVRLGDADDVCVAHGGAHFTSTPHALAILHAFARPRAVAEVLASAAAGPEHWIELSETILQFVSAGILRPPATIDAPTVPRGFANPTIHVVMLDDASRTRGYLRALRAVTKDGDVVVDIGTGTGVLATSAALAGAAHVYAVESSAIADAAQRVFEANGVADRVTLVRGRSTQLELPARADVLVTEIIGNDPLDELLLEVIKDAKDRLLVPGARLVPCAIEVVAQAVEVPPKVFERHAFTAERLEAWRTAYGIDFSSLASVRRHATQPITLRIDEFLSWKCVAEPVSLVTIDLTKPFDTAQASRVSIVMAQDVAHLGVVLAFRLTLAPGIVVSTLADEVGADSHWRYALWPTSDRRPLARGARATIDYVCDRGVTTLRLS